MEEKDYKEKLVKMEADFEKAKNDLHIEYAMSQAKFKKGDIIKEGDKLILIQRITTYVSFGMPEPVYRGPELKKDLTPKKSGNIEAIFGSSKHVELIKSA